MTRQFTITWALFVTLTLLLAGLASPGFAAEEQADDGPEAATPEATQPQTGKSDPEASCGTTDAEGEADQAEAKPQWKSLFDGKQLGKWKSTKFGGEGKVEVRDGMIVMPCGSDMTGITYTGKPPRENYELKLQGKRLDGSDFFCTTTFPVGKDYCSLVVGGWGGTVVGLSSVDYYDASDNLTTNFMTFKDDVWYDVRIRVSKHRISAWIGDKQMVNQIREGHKFDIRFEVDPSRPLGISTWQTGGAVRAIEIRDLTPEEIAADVVKEDEVY